MTLLDSSPPTESVGSDRVPQHAPSELHAVDPVTPDPSPIATRSTKASGLARGRLARMASLVLVMALIGTAVAVAWRIKSQATAANSSRDTLLAKPVRVGVSSVWELTAPELTSTFRGVVIPRREAELAFRRTGRIESICVDAGDEVKAGTVMGWLDASDLQAELAVAESELAVAEAQYEEALAGPRSQAIRAAEARVAQLEAQAMAARKRLERQEMLMRQRATSTEELDNERFAVNRLDASVDEAKSQLDELVEGTRREQLRAAQSRVRMAEAQIQLTRVAIEDSKLVAPFDCVIGTRMQDEGAMASPNLATLSIIERPPLEARFGLPSRIARSIKVGETLPISIGKEMVSPCEAEVVRMQPRVDPVTRTREVVVQFDSADVSLVGEPAALLLPWRADTSEAAEGRLRVWMPSSALVRSVRGLWGVYAVETSDVDQPGDNAKEISGTVRMLDAKVVRTAGTQSLVDVPLRPDHVIITAGMHRVGPGAQVVAAMPMAQSVELKRLASGGVR